MSKPIATMNDTVLRAVQSHLALIFHAHRCRQQEQQTTSSLVCTRPDCVNMRNTLAHMIQCSDQENCSCRLIITIQ